MAKVKLMITCTGGVYKWYLLSEGTSKTSSNSAIKCTCCVSCLNIKVSEVRFINSAWEIILERSSCTVFCFSQLKKKDYVKKC